MNVLIVEDDLFARGMLVELVERAGHRVYVADDGATALDALRDVPNCRLIITAGDMPRMSGPALCQAIRASDLSGSTYLVLATAPNSPQERLVGLTAGVDDFLTKPFDSAEVAARLRIAERILAKDTRDMTIFVLAKLAESRDAQCGAHLDRMRAYARILAWHLSGVPAFANVIDRGFLRTIYATAPLHDIGKVGIPDRILLKPGRLTPEEFEVMKTHADIGALALQSALDQSPDAAFLRMARDIAATHHEKFDGSGYPAGLAGDAIPLSGRIVALADVYDALTTRRVYKPAFPHELAKQMILEGSGRDFDPGIVSAFLACEEQFVAVSMQTVEADASLLDACSVPAVTV